MSGVLIHDGRRVGHRKWCVEAVDSGSADGVILNPFSTPRVAEPRHPSASDLALEVQSVNGEVVFDAMTHALFLPGTNRRDFYDAWELWGRAGCMLERPAQQLAHVERVFNRQGQFGAPHLTPTLQLQSPQSSDGHRVLDIASHAGLTLIAGNRLLALVPSGQLVHSWTPTWGASLRSAPRSG